jgi:hypothetical protein
MEIMSVQPTKLERLHRDFSDTLSEMLKGEPLVDANGTAVLDELGKPIYVRPKAAILKEIREFLKDNGIDSEPIEGTPVDSVAKKLTQFDGDPLYLEETASESQPE